MIDELGAGYSSENLVTETLDWGDDYDPDVYDWYVDVDSVDDWYHGVEWYDTTKEAVTVSGYYTNVDGNLAEASLSLANTLTTDVTTYSWDSTLRNVFSVLSIDDFYDGDSTYHFVLDTDVVDDDIISAFSYQLLGGITWEGYTVESVEIVTDGYSITEINATYEPITVSSYGLTYTDTITVNATISDTGSDISAAIQPVEGGEIEELDEALERLSDRNYTLTESYNWMMGSSSSIGVYNYQVDGDLVYDTDYATAYLADNGYLNEIGVLTYTETEVVGQDPDTLTLSLTLDGYGYNNKDRELQVTGDVSVIFSGTLQDDGFNADTFELTSSSLTFSGVGSYEYLSDVTVYDIEVSGSFEDSEGGSTTLDLTYDDQGIWSISDTEIAKFAPTSGTLTGDGYKITLDADGEIQTEATGEYDEVELGYLVVYLSSFGHVRVQNDLNDVFADGVVSDDDGNTIMTLNGTPVVVEGETQYESAVYGVGTYKTGYNFVGGSPSYDISSQVFTENEDGSYSLNSDLNVSASSAELIVDSWLLDSVSDLTITVTDDEITLTIEGTYYSYPMTIEAVFSDIGTTDLTSVESYYERFLDEGQEISDIDFARVTDFYYESACYSWLTYDGTLYTDAVTEENAVDIAESIPVAQYFDAADAYLGWFRSTTTTGEYVYPVVGGYIPASYLNYYLNYYLAPSLEADGWTADGSYYVKQIETGGQTIQIVVGFSAAYGDSSGSTYILAYSIQDISVVD